MAIYYSYFYAIFTNFRLSLEHSSNGFNGFDTIILLLNVYTCYNLRETIVDMRNHKGITSIAC
jgi:hypothetical protein